MKREKNIKTSRGKLHHERMHTVMYSPYRLEVCMISSKLHVDPVTFDSKQLRPSSLSAFRRWRMAMSCGEKTNLPCSSANSHDDPQIYGQKINLRFVAQQIRCGYNWLSEKTPFMLCDSS